MWVCPGCGRAFKRKNQGHYCGDAPKSVDEYVASQPEGARLHMMKIIGMIRSEVPEAREQIKWGMPSFHAGKYSMQFSACKDRLSLYIGADAIENLKGRLEGFAYKKDALYLPYDRPLPVGLVKEIIRIALPVADDGPKVYEYDGMIVCMPENGGAYVRFPWDVREEFGKGRIKIHALFDGEPYDGSIVNMGVKNEDGSICYIIGITKAVRARIGKGDGDPVHVVVAERKDPDREGK